MNARNIGTFSIPRRMIDGDKEILLELFAGMIVVRAELRFDTDAIEYTAISDKFEPVDINRAAPHYSVWWSQGRWQVRKETLS